MNEPATPPSSAADQLHALLAVIADPAAHKARLDELVAQENAAKEQIAALNEMAADTRRMNSAAKAQNIVSDNRKTALDAREAEIGERAKQLDLATAAQKAAAQQAEQKFRQRESDIAKREAAVKAREDDFSTREEALAKAEANVRATTERLQRQAAAVKVALAQ